MADSTSGTAAEAPIPSIGSPLNDPDFAGSSRVPAPLDPNLYPDDDLRMVLNPFLSALVIVLTTVAARWAVRQWSLEDGWLLGTIFASLAVAVAGGMLGLQCHCLDCGATVPFRRWRSHTCERVRARRALGRRRRFVGPKPFLQLFVWIIILLIVVLLIGPRSRAQPSPAPAAPNPPTQRR